MPWVDEIKHLGNVLESNNSMKRDIAVKRGKFIGKLNSLSQESYSFSEEKTVCNFVTWLTSYNNSL